MKNVRKISAEVMAALNLVVDALGDDPELLHRIIHQLTYDHTRLPRIVRQRSELGELIAD